MTNFEHYRVFFHVARLGSITRAAESLCVSQPAVSQTIRLLEQAVGCPLLVRNARGVTLTPEGNVLFAHISRGYGHFAEAEEKVRELLSLASGTLRIGASDMALRFFLLPQLEIFNRAYPDVRIHITNRPTPETLQMLGDGEIDLGFVSEPVSVPAEGLLMQPLQRIEDIFVAGERFAGLRDARVTWAELAEKPLILLEPKTSTRAHLDGFLSSRGVRLDPEFELASSDLIVRFAERNLGIGCVVRGYAEDAFRTGGLFEVKTPEPVPGRNLCLATLEGIPLSPSARRLVEQVAAARPGKQ